MPEAERDQEVGVERGRDRDSQKDFIFSDDEPTPEPMNEVGGMRNHEMIMESTSDTHLAPGQPEALLKNRPDKQLSAIDESRGSPLRDSQVSYPTSHIHVTTTEPCIAVHSLVCRRCSAWTGLRLRTRTDLESPVVLPAAGERHVDATRDCGPAARVTAVHIHRL